MGGGPALLAASKRSQFSFNQTTLPTQPDQLLVTEIMPSNSSSSEPECSNPHLFSSAQLQTPSFKIEHQDFINSVTPSVFREAPSLEEAKKATSDLIDALRMICLPSTNADDWLESRKVAQEPTPGYSKTKAYVVKELVASYMSPYHACQALSLLNESYEAQTAVASIASDENVWNAVMQNDKVMEFLRLLKSNPLPPDMDMVVKEPVADETNTKGLEHEHIIVKVKNKIKLAMLEILNSFSGLLEVILGDLASSDHCIDGDGKGSASNIDISMGAKFVALGILAIMMAVLKRVLLKL